LSRPQPLPRETGKDIGMGSPVLLSAEAVGVITRLRNMKVGHLKLPPLFAPRTYPVLIAFAKDQDEDWSRWRDVVFKAKGRLHPKGMPKQKLPPQNRRKRGGPAWTETEGPGAGSTPGTEQSSPRQEAVPLTEEEALTILDPTTPSAENPLLRVAPPPDAPTESYLPLHPDPLPERLYIFLHALRYTTSLGVFETDMPEWAAEGWKLQHASGGGSVSEEQ